MQALLDGGGPPDRIALADSDPVALAWAFKDACYTAWMRQPSLARRCADWLALLADTAPSTVAMALAHWTRGIAQLAEGDAAGALGSLTQASRDLAAIGEPHRAAEAQVPQLVALALCGRHDDALALGKEARDRFVASGDEPAAGRVELNLASMLLRQGRYAEAGQHYRGASLRFAQAGDRQHSVMADIGLAAALAWQFEFDESERIYARASHRARAHGLDALLGVIENNRGEFELNRGRHAQALNHLAVALACFERQGSPHQLAEGRRNLADAYAALGLWPEAEDLYGQAVAAARSMGAPVEEAWAVVQRAQSRAAQGADAAAARDLAEARVLFQAHGGSVGIGRVSLCAAALALRAGDAGQALDQALGAAAAFEAAGVRGWLAHANMLAAEALAACGRVAEAQARWQSTLHEAGDLPEIQAGCCTGLGHLLRAAGDQAGARGHYESAVAAIENQRAALPDDEFRTAYGAGRGSAHDALVDLALDGTDVQRLFAAMEGARAQALRHGLARAEARNDAMLPERERWQWLHTQWRHALAKDDAGQAAALKGRVRQAEREWLEASRRGCAVARPVVRATTGPPLPPRLPEGQALVEYVQAGQRLAACVVTHKGMHRVDLDGRDLDERIDRLRLQLDTLRHGVPGLHRHAGQLAERARHHLAALHAQLWAPLEPLLEGVQRVVIVPHRGLHYVPFCALFDGKRHLVERVTTSLAPSAALWVSTAVAPRPLRRLLALGHGGGGLPHVAAELRALGDVFGADSRLLLDERATQASLRECLEGVDILHLACHAEFRADSPYFSALHLADGPLTLRDAASLPMRVGLVTLSACETGVSKQAPGDELLGMVRGFLLAGAPAVLATLWTVDDAATATLMADFYRHLRAGESPAEALRQAQCASMANNPNPHFWAPFSVHGRG